MFSAKKDALKNFVKFKGKDLCWASFLIKLGHKKGIPTQVFSCEFCEIFQNTFFTENLWTTAFE